MAKKITYSACLMLLYYGIVDCSHYKDGLCKHTKYCSSKETWEDEII